MFSGAPKSFVFYALWNDCGTKNIAFYVDSGITGDEDTVKYEKLGEPESSDTVKYVVSDCPPKHRKTHGLNVWPG